MTVLDLVTASLRRINAIQPAETPSAEDAQLGLDALRLMIDLWATERLTLGTVTRTTWTITANVATYTVGLGATVNVARPATTDLTINIIDTSPTPDIELSLGVPLTDDAYAAIPQKAATSTYPTAVYYNPTFGATGFGALTLWPVPTSTSLLGVFYSPAAMTEPTTLSTVLYTPPGYRAALVDNLAMRLCAEFRIAPSPTLPQSAADAFAWIKRSNIRLTDLSLDPALTRMGGRGRSNIYTGQT